MVRVKTLYTCSARPKNIKTTAKIGGGGWYTDVHLASCSVHGSFLLETRMRTWMRGV